ncbi:MAG: hypothetical protein FJ086_08925 [Deltaproteobacteria bacterium]|nr:hypothetical protein [Deltaproteobacteria bacterium]
MSNALSHLLLGALLLCASGALAREVKEFTGGTAPAAKKRNTGTTVNGWTGEDASVEVKDPPWMAIGLGVIVLAIAAPFAWRTYRNTAEEIEGAKATGRRGSNSDDQA